MRFVKANFLALIIFTLLVPNALANTPYMVFELNSGRVHKQYKAFDRWYPASITKIMTAYTVFKEIEAGRISRFSPVKISAYALSKPPSKIGYPVGTVLNVDNALKIIMVKSANDVTTALAESVAGSEANFVALMNQHAARLGLNDTHYVNPHGLHDTMQYSSARDIAILASQIYREFPAYAPYFSISAIQVGKKTMKNHNGLLHRFEGTVGMKTGFICAGGVSMVAAARIKNKTYIAIVLGKRKARQRNIQAAELITEASGKWFTLALPKLKNLKPNGPVNRTPIDRRQAGHQNQLRLIS